ncbi:751_t:CDS:1, partial [Gigaspora rosea]
MYPSNVNRILITKSSPHPRSSTTPSGGKMMAKITLKISENVIAICVGGDVVVLQLLFQLLLFLDSNYYAFYAFFYDDDEDAV